MSTKTKKRIILALKVTVVLLVFLWIGWEIHRSWNRIHQIQWNPSYFYLSAAGLFYLLGYAPSALFWNYSLKKLGQSPGFYETVRAYYIGHLGKYVPGKAMAVILRSGLLDHRHTRPSVAAAAVFLETLTMMACGAFLSALIILVWFRDMQYGNLLVLIALGMMLVSSLPILPPIFRFMTQRLGVGRNDPDIDQKLRGLNLNTLAVGWGLTAIGWCFLGLSLWATLKGVGIQPGPIETELPRFVLAATLPVVLGFVMMIPAGIGVRDLAMAQVLVVYLANLLMQTGIPANVALETATLQAYLIAAVQRLVSIFAELFISALLIRSPKKSPDQNDPA